MKKSLRSRPGAGSDAGLRTVVWTAVAGLVAFVGWAALADIDQVTRAPAQIISSSRTQLIQAADGGVMTQLLVREGAKVQRGQVLARFDATRLKAAYSEVEARAAGLRATVQRAEAEIAGNEPRFDPIVQRYPSSSPTRWHCWPSAVRPSTRKWPPSPACRPLPSGNWT